MENRELSALAEAIAGRIFVELEASGRHVHVTAQQALVLFGHPLTPKRPLSQPGQYLSNERVTVIGPRRDAMPLPVAAMLMAVAAFFGNHARMSNATGKMPPRPYPRPVSTAAP